jgi:3-hydroxyisobutyrate dehydrogenase
MAEIGFIGLGNMGGPMAANLVRAGHRVRGYDRVDAARAALGAAGGGAAGSVAEAVVGAEIVVTMLPAGEHVREVLTASDGVLAHAAHGALLIDCSTIDVATARDMAAQAAARGFAMLDAPVSGGVSGASAGTLTFMVGGTQAEFDRAQPALTAMGKTIVLAGDAGAGQAAKVCNNLILGISMLAVSEAFALADKLGLSAQALFDISKTASGQCWALTSYCPVPGPVPTSPANRDYQPGFATALMLKDLTLATDAAASTGAASVLGEHARAAYQRLAELGMGNKDFSVAARALLEGQLGR